MYSPAPFMEWAACKLLYNKLRQKEAMVIIGIEKKCIQDLIFRGILIHGLVFLELDHRVLKLGELDVLVKQVSVGIPAVFSRKNVS